jgi:hypothetical protein
MAVPCLRLGWRAGTMKHKACHLGAMDLPVLIVGAGLLLCLAALPSAGAAGPPPAGFRQLASTGEQPALRKLTQDHRSTPLAWTADGRSLLVQRPGRTLARQALSELWAVSVSDGQERQLADNALHPVLHDDSVAYLRFAGEGRWQVAVAGLEGKAAVQLGEAQWALPPAWVEGSLNYLSRSAEWMAVALPQLSERASTFPGSLPQQPQRARLAPDGRSTAVTDGQRLWVSGQQESEVARAEQVFGFAWSPAGDRLAYVVTNDGPAPEMRVWDAAGEQSRVLVRGEMEYFGAPAWSPDGITLAFVRQPTGNGPNVAGDIWLVHAAGGTPRALALTPADERAPCWAPDGHRLAFEMDGDVWIADLDAPGLAAALAEASATSQDRAAGLDLAHAPASGVSPLQVTAPLMIRVKHDDLGNTCRAVPDGQIDVYSFEEYVKRVVPFEVHASWPAEALKAQAVAARTYAWRKVIDAQAQNLDFDVWDSTKSQYMCDRTDSRTNAAVDETRGQYISYDGSVVYAFFCAETGSPTNYKQQFDLARVPYLRPVNDPVGFGATRNGHSWGMSQWGAYRWATWHGWDYQQILCHYYTSASIKGSDPAAQPLPSLALPWPNFYVNTDHAYLHAHAPTAGLAVTFTARLTDTWTTIHADTDGSDGWAYVWPVDTISDTTTPAMRLRIAVSDGSGRVVESSDSRIGLHRTPPAGTLDTPSSEVATLALPLQLTISDPFPVEGGIRVSLGDRDWVWEDTALYAIGGGIVADSGAGDGSAWHVGGGSSGVLFGPYTTVLPAGRQYRALFRLKVPEGALGDPRELAKLDVTLNAGTELLGVRYVRGTDFQAQDTYQEFAVDFNYPAQGGAIEFRTDAASSGYGLWADRVSIAYYPVEASSWMTWTLPAREGTSAVAAWFEDGAGNLSPAATLAVTVTDTAPPADWRTFQCDGLACTVQVRDVIAGLDVGSAAYRSSANGGASWSGWASAACTGVDGSHGWETIAAAPLPDPPAAGEEPILIQFRIDDRAAAANEGQSPTYSLWRIYLPVATQSE